MRLVLLVVGGCLASAVLACGSDDSSASGGGASGASGTATSAGGKSSGSSGSSSGGSTGGSNSHAGTTSMTAGTAGMTAGTAGATAGTAGTTAGTAGTTSTLSPACQKFCDCHEANCASLPIPDGKSCGDFCEAMTEDQLACRQNMCKLVPDQPDNDHCKHSLGIDQCL